jgi:hypothetical protein
MNKPTEEKNKKNWVDRAQAHVLELHNQKQDARFVYHNYQLTAAFTEEVLLLSEEAQLDEQQQEMALIAAWFANTGYLFDYQEYTHYSQLVCEKFLKTHNYPELRTKKVLHAIDTLKKKASPDQMLDKVLSDAYTIVTLCRDFEEKSALLQLEWEFLLDRKMSVQEVKIWKLQRLLNAQLFTHYARTTYEASLSQSIQEQKAKADKFSLKQAEEEYPGDLSKRRFGKIEKEVPERGVQTFFRANYRNHINLSSIADGKANIMISVNTILISVLISILSYRNITETTPMILLPVVLFIVTGMASLVFAVLSARPKITSLNKKGLPPSEIRKNIVFFGNFVRLDLEEYEQAMDDLFSDSELLYGNLTRDLYFLGKVLDKKYRYLTISYNVFMVGFIVTVMTFLVVLFMR